MKTTLAFLLLLVTLHTTSVLGHTYLSSLTVNNQALNEGDCIRPHPPQNKEYPILYVNDADMTCGWQPYASQPANRKCLIDAGSTVGLQWHHNSNSPSDDIIASTHLGPCLVYLAKSDTGAGPVWFKIYENGYDASSNKWCVDTLLANHGLLTITIPSDISPGNYLLRGEILALHSANALNGVQPYVGCAEITISGSGSANPSGVSFPGAYTNTDPGMLFNIYGPYTYYPIPGPTLYKPQTTTTTTTTQAPQATTTTTTRAPQSTTTTTKAPQSTTTTTTTQPPKKTSPTTTTTQSPHTTTTTTQAPHTTTTSSNVRIQLFPSSSDWWLAVAVRSSKEVRSVSLKDSGSIKDWEPLVETNWGYWAFPTSKQMVLPITLLLTSSDNIQLEIPNAFTSWSLTTFQDTGLDFSDKNVQIPAVTDSSTPSPTPEKTSAPAPASKTTPSPQTDSPSDSVSSGNSISVHIHKGSTVWWFALQLMNQGESTANIEVKDSLSQVWMGFDRTSWGYWMVSTKGSPLTVPLTLRLTANNGKSVIFTLNEISPDATIDTAQQYI